MKVSSIPSQHKTFANEKTNLQVPHEPSPLAPSSALVLETRSILAILSSRSGVRASLFSSSANRSSVLFTFSRRLAEFTSSAKASFSWASWNSVQTCLAMRSLSSSSLMVYAGFGGVHQRFVIRNRMQILCVEVCEHFSVVLGG